MLMGNGEGRGVNAAGKEEAFLGVKSTEPVSESVG